MSALPSTAPDGMDVLTAMPASPIGRLKTVFTVWLDRVRASEYQQVGASRRFLASQRRRCRVAARVGLVVIAGAVAFDAVALIGFDFETTRLAVAIDLTVLAAAIVGWWTLGGRLRHHPELVAWVVTMSLGISTITTGSLVPSLAVQTVGYLLLIPGLVALLLPWRTTTHMRWLLSYSLIELGYFSIGALGRFSASERGDLAVVFTVSLGASLAGHVLLQRAQVRNYAQLRRIGRLSRKTESDMVELARLHHALELTARTDPLTGAGNRRRLDEDLRAVRAHMVRSGLAYGIAEIDLDHFKAINDRYGHAAGDDVLRRVSQALSNSLRATDGIYRLGGEEFLVVVQVASSARLAAAAEHLRSVVIDLAIEHPDNGTNGMVSVSVGATFLRSRDLDQSNDEWIARADAGLYRAKRAGRNQVCLTDG